MSGVQRRSRSATTVRRGCRVHGGRGLVGSLQSNGSREVLAPPRRKSDATRLDRASGGVPAGTRRRRCASDARAAERLEAALKGLSSLRAGFHQTVTDAQAQTESAEGTVRSRGPANSAGITACLRSSSFPMAYTVWLYDVDLRKSPFDRPRIRSPGRRRCSLRQADLGADWIATAARLRPPVEPAHAEGADSDFRELSVGIAGGELRRMVMVDRLGQTMRLEFEHIERNPRLTRLPSASRRLPASTSWAARQGGVDADGVPPPLDRGGPRACRVHRLCKSRRRSRLCLNESPVGQGRALPRIPVARPAGIRDRVARSAAAPCCAVSCSARHSRSRKRFSRNIAWPSGATAPQMSRGS